MKISKQSWIIKWAYLEEIILAKLGDKEVFEVPKNTTVCQIIGRTFIKSPFFIILFPTVGILLLAILSPLLPFLWLSEDFPKTKPYLSMKKKWNQSLIKTAIDDFKNKTCTRIELE